MSLSFALTNLLQQAHFAKLMVVVAQTAETMSLVST